MLLSKVKRIRAVVLYVIVFISFICFDRLLGHVESNDQLYYSRFIFWLELFEVVQHWVNFWCFRNVFFFLLFGSLMIELKAYLRHCILQADFSVSNFHSFLLIDVAKLFFVLLGYLGIYWAFLVKINIQEVLSLPNLDSKLPIWSINDHPLYHILQYGYFYPLSIYRKISHIFLL